nr:YihY/virulence factor BrkB family protein [Halobellus ruber]
MAVVRSVVETVRDREVTFLAAGISYYVLVSLVPLLTFGVVVATVVGGADLATRVQAVAGAYLLPTGSDLVAGALADRSGQGALSVVSLTVTTWGALKLFRGVDVAFARIYGYPTSPILQQLSDGVVVLATLGAAAVGVAVTTAVIAVADLPFVGVVGPLVLLSFLVVAFLPLYAVIPDVPVPLRSALPGALLSAVGWTGLSAAFSIYARVSTGVAGALGGVLLLVTWFYASGILVLTGAAANAVLADRVGVPLHREDHGTRRFAPAADGDRDRQVQQPRVRGADRTMSAEDASDDDAGDPAADAPDDGATDVDPRGAPDIEQLDRRVEELRSDLAAFEEDVESRTVDRPTLKADLERYVRGRLRRGKARGWGPYLVLLYGTAATISAFYFLEDDLLAVVAMVIIYLSTLGLYTLFVVFGVGLNALGVPGRFVDWIRDRRS